MSVYMDAAAVIQRSWRRYYADKRFVIEVCDAHAWVALPVAYTHACVDLRAVAQTDARNIIQQAVWRCILRKRTKSKMAAGACVRACVSVSRSVGAVSP